MKNQNRIFNIKPYYQVFYNPNGECKIFSNRGGSTKELSQWVNSNGYLCTKIGGKTTLIHSLVALIFLGKRKPGLTVNHKDCNKLNNRIENLEYITIAENIKHAIINGLHVSTDPKRSGRYKDGRAIKSRIKQYKHEWYEANKSK